MATGGLFGTAGLREMRRFVARTFTATAAVQAQTTVVGAGGVVTTTWATVDGLDAVPCAFRPAASPAEVPLADAVQAVARLTVTLPPGTAVGASNRLLLTHSTPGLPSPLTVQVIGVEARATEITRRVLCERVGGES